MTKFGYSWRRFSSKIFFRTFAAFLPPHREALDKTGIRIVSVGLNDEQARLVQNEVWESLKTLNKYAPARFKRIIKEIAVVFTFIKGEPGQHFLTGSRIFAINLSSIPTGYSPQMRQIAIAGGLVYEATLSVLYRRGIPPSELFNGRAKKISELERLRTIRRLRKALSLLGDSQDQEIAHGAGTTIHEQAGYGNVKEVEAMLKGNPDLVFSKDEHDETPLHHASRNGCKEVAELLLANKADVNALDIVNGTPLHAAAYGGHKEMAALLLANNADANAAKKDGWAPLHWAACNGYRSIAELLCAHKAEVDAKDKTGNTPLHYSASRGYKDIANLLLSNKAGVDIKNGEGATPLHLATFHNQRDVAELLLDHQADVNAQTNGGRTPLDIALAKKHSKTAELLRRRGGRESMR